MLLRTYRGQKEHLETAEARVNKLNAKIKKLSFAPGKRDVAKIKELTELRDDAQRVVFLAKKDSCVSELSMQLSFYLTRGPQAVVRRLGVLL